MFLMLNKVVYLYYKDEQVVFECLNWIIGLQFSSWLELLVLVCSVSELLFEKVWDEFLFDQVCQG